MAKKKPKKIVVRKFKIPEGSHAINPFYFELNKLWKIIEECEARKLHSLAMALKTIAENITEKRNSYHWIEPE